MSTSPTGTPVAPTPPRSKVRMLGATILVCEVLVMYCAALTGYGLEPVPVAWLIGGAAVITAVIVAAAATLPRYRGENRIGIALGWTAQVLILACGLVMVPMFFVGALFGVLWAVAIYWGRRMDRELTEREAAAGA
ncbi:DUF4233 domain-containing protein [Brevibacterium litoralis]|uniref:DUF4233 domain-containing protein n=1 Tax=Brevibacterium litoralis TaxID=3138935 RepID=UPI0032EC8AC5